MGANSPLPWPGFSTDWVFHMTDWFLAPDPQTPPWGWVGLKRPNTAHPEFFFYNFGDLKLFFPAELLNRTISPAGGYSLSR